MNNITYRRLEDNINDFKLIYEWNKNKDVYEWFEQRILSLEEIIKKYQKKLNNKKQDIYIIKINNQDIGLFQIYRFNNDINLNISNNIYEYDLFIGNNKYLNKGYGKLIVDLINQLIFNTYKGDIIILRPFKRNIRAINCYKKCGFIEYMSYIDKDTLGNKEEIVVLIKN